MHSIQTALRFATCLPPRSIRARLLPAAALLSAACSSNGATSQQSLDASSGADVGSDDSGSVADVASAVDSGVVGPSSDGGGAGGSSDGGDAGASASDGGDAGGRAPDGGAVSVSIRFKATVGAQAFACGTTYPGQGSTGASVQPQDFRFYVQDVRLIDDKGQEVAVSLDTRSPWQTPDVALLDFEDGTGACAAEGNPDLNDRVTGTVPAGTYTGIVFRNGVPDSLDHADPLSAPPPLQPAPMTWGWLYGYKFVKAELAATSAPAGDAAPGLGLLHLGSVGCTEVTDGGADSGILAACTQPDRNEIRLTGYSPGSSTIVADIGAIFRGVDLSQDNQCHSGGPACPSMFAAAGVDLSTGAALVTQSIYRVE